MNMDKKKKLRIIATVLCVILIAGVVLNQSGLLKRTEAESVWDGTFPSTMTASNYTYGTNAAGKRGNGSQSSPYYISTAPELAQMVVNINGGLYSGKEVYFQLANIINLDGKQWRPIGVSNVANTVYFDGNSSAGYKITGLSLTSTGSQLNQGLFGYLNGGSVSNLSVEGANLQLSTTGGSSAGGIVGLATGGCQITNCSFAGTISGYSDVGGIVGTCEEGSMVNRCSVASGSNIKGVRQRVGGIVGFLNSSSRVINCSNAGNVNLDAATNTSNPLFTSASGLVGYMEASDVVNSFNSGRVGSSHLASGIATAVGGAIRNCYNRGAVSADTNGRAGGICASINSVTQMRNVFALEGVATSLFAEGATGNTNLQNVGAFESGQFCVKPDFLDESRWSLGSGTLLKSALDSYVSTGLATYDNICEWAEDDANVNGGYPILTNKVGHVHDKAGAQTVLKEATCTDLGIVQYTCSQCGLIYQEETNAKGHSHVTVSTPPACETEGITVEKCGNTWHDEDGNEVACDYVWKSQTTSALGHHYYTGNDLSKYEVAPTCEKDGYYVETCIRPGCGYENESTRVTADKDPKYKATGHAWEEYGSDAANCTEPERHYQECKSCKSIQTVTGPAVELGHDWDNVDGVYRASTCIQEGGMVRRCNRCQFEEFVGTPEAKVPHEYVTDRAVDATCTEAGYTELICSVCNEESSRVQVNFVNPIGHNFMLESVVESTCTVPGYEHEVCTNRGCTETRDVNPKPLKAHDYVVSNTTNTSCLIGGRIDETCTVCGDSFYTIISPIGHHDYHDDPELSTPATCTEDGQDKQRCWVCGDVQTVNTISALGHEFEDIVTEPTCLFGGFTTRTCARGCGYEEILNERGPLDHDMVETVHPATTTSMGYTESACSRCDLSETYDYVAATPDATYDAVSATLIFNSTPAAVETDPIVLFRELITGQADDDTGEVMAYSLDNVEWVTTDAVSVKITEDDLVFTTDSALKAANVYVQRMGNMASESRPISDSAVQILEIVRADIPPSAIISGNPPLSEGGKGDITGVNETMEWRAAADKTWTEVVGNTIENLEPGIYYVRAKATGSSPAGPEMMVTVPQYNSGGDIPTPPPGTTTTPPDGTTPPPGTTITPPGGTTPPPGTTTIPPNADGSGNGNGSGNNGSGTGNGNNSSNSNGSGTSGNGSGSGSNGSSSGGTNVDANGNVIPNNVYYSSGGSGSSSSGSSKSSNSATRVTSARTGDETNVAVWLVVAGVAAAAFAVVSARKRRDAEE